MAARRILIMGLPGAGKTFFADALKQYLETASDFYHAQAESLTGSRATVEWFNADDVRRRFDDWDFTSEGRIRQSRRMRELADKSWADFVIADFVAPLAEMRDNFHADWTVWMDTVDAGRFEDTNRMFVPPTLYDFRITEQNAEHWTQFVGEHILDGRRRPVFNSKKETVQQLGRWQPWHAGHRALFERLLQRTGQVCIMIRDCEGWNQSNPFGWSAVKDAIRRDLDPLYQGQYEIVVVPNITHIGYGRGVGYTMAEEHFDETITSISGTKIRKEMGLE